VSTRILTLLATSLIFIFTSSAASAQKVDINLSQESARLTYISLVGGSNFGRTEMNIGLLYNEDDNGLFDLGLQVIDVAGSKTPGLELGVGPRLYYLTHDKTDLKGAAVALGGHMRYKLPSVRRLAFRGTLYYAPAITSTMDTDNMHEISLGIAYELLPTADVYLTHRRIRAKFNKGVGTETIDSGISVGMKVSF